MPKEKPAPQDDASAHGSRNLAEHTQAEANPTKKNQELISYPLGQQRKAEAKHQQRLEEQVSQPKPEHQQEAKKLPAKEKQCAQPPLKKQSPGHEPDRRAAAVS